VRLGGTPCKLYPPIFLKLFHAPSNLITIKPHQLGNAIFTHWPKAAQTLHNLFKVLLGEVYGLICGGVAS
jgi:hypothetical protein